MTDELKTPNPGGFDFSKVPPTEPVGMTPEQIAASVGGKIVEEIPQPTTPVVQEEVALTFTPEEEAFQKELRQGSGEEDLGQGWTFIPYITINNEKVEYQLQGGGTVMAPCKPEFSINEKEGDDYTKTLFAPEFDAVIIKFMNRVQRKVVMDQSTPPKIKNKMPYFRSLEFKSFQSDIYIMEKQADGKYNNLPAMKYDGVKEYSKEENELWGIVYFLIPGEDVVRKGEFKGASRSVLYDYMTAKRDYSVSSVVTKFSGEQITDQGQVYNRLKLVNTGLKAPELAKVVSAQKSLNAMIDANLIPNKLNGDEKSNAVSGDIISKEETKQIEDKEIKVKGIPF